MSLLCDIGNSFAHFYDGKRLWSVGHEELERYKDQKVCYINVKVDLKKRLEGFSNWIDLEPYIKIASAYEGLGVDRKALCLAVEEGVVVDAGSAITVDLMREGKHVGGFIYPGIKALEGAYASISSRLEYEIEEPPSKRLPLSTREAVSYGALVPLVEHIQRLHTRVYITGGDGRLLASLMEGASYDRALIFKGLEKIKDGLC